MIGEDLEAVLLGDLLLETLFERPDFTDVEVPDDGDILGVEEGEDEEEEEDDTLGADEARGDDDNDDGEALERMEGLEVEEEESVGVDEILVMGEGDSFEIDVLGVVFLDDIVVVDFFDGWEATDFMLIKKK